MLCASCVTHSPPLLPLLPSPPSPPPSSQTAARHVLGCVWKSPRPRARSWTRRVGLYPALAARAAAARRWGACVCNRSNLSLLAKHLVRAGERERGRERERERESHVLARVSCVHCSVGCLHPHPPPLLTCAVCHYIAAAAVCLERGQLCCGHNLQALQNCFGCFVCDVDNKVASVSVIVIILLLILVCCTEAAAATAAAAKHVICHVQLHKQLFWWI